MMGKALAVLLLTATMATPIPAQAQGWQGRNGDRTVERGEPRGGGRGQARPETNRRETPPANTRARGADQRWSQRGGNGGMNADRGPRRATETRPAPATPRQAPGMTGVRERNDANRWNHDRRDNAQQAERRWNNDRRNNDRRANGDWNRERSTNQERARQADRRWDNDRRDDNRRNNDNWNRERQNQERWNQERARQNDRRDDRRWNDGRGNDNRWNDGRWNDGRNDRRWSGNDRDNRHWNRDWRRDNRYDWQRYRSANRSIYRAPRYYSPRGYGYDYRRWSYGYRLPDYYYGDSYWIDDPWAYRLPPAYGPYRWVRYYDDVLLVDITNGIIRDIIYSFFWR